MLLEKSFFVNIDKILKDVPAKTLFFPVRLKIVKINVQLFKQIAIRLGEKNANF